MAPAADKDLFDHVETTFPSLPPFSKAVPTAPLLRISLQKLANGDQSEEARLWDTCRDVGFFYLDMRMGDSGPVDVDGVKENEIDGNAILDEKDRLFELMKDMYALPAEEKVKYDRTAEGIYFGYKSFGRNILDKKGTRDRNEYWNVSKNDVLGDSEPQPNPDVIKEKRPLFASYVTHTHAITTLIMRILNDKLGLQPGTFAEWHRLHGPSGDQVRLIHVPPQPPDDRTLSNGEHTDFGSVTVLFNKVGGLQIRLPPGMNPIPPSDVDDPSTIGKVKYSQDGSEMTAEEDSEWAYVVPIPGHAVINLGDAMTKFSAGVLRSNIHRVISPPGAQADCERYSLVYFTRPEYDVKLRHLGAESEIIMEHLKKTGRENEVEEVYTSREWVNKMSLGRRDMTTWSHSGGKKMDNLRQGVKT
ncbi:Clavaminate synthase-like protein [Rhizodiscina lignyota]|uniref:Clavaminate synthase-like protein n=1 Tax=Rhizodiscina lignyota TaxID=1504668 RepID=A0A9P4IRP1_9PEZI|nr:Clavaminate synthase-like protein [Rhizodiscina lignyota]